MKWTDEEIDQLFTRVSADHKAEFREEYWDEMEMLLDANKPSKKRIGWWIFGSLSGLFSLVFGAYFLANSHFFSESSGTSNTLDVINKENMQAVAKSTNESALQFRSDLRELQAKTYDEDYQHSFLALSSTEKVLTGLQFYSSTNRIIDGYWNLKMGPYRSSSSFYRDIVQQRENELEHERIKKLEKGKVKVPPVRSVNPPIEKVALQESVASNELKSENGMSSMDFIDLNSEKASLDDPYTQVKRVGYYVGIGAGAGYSYFSNSDELVTQWKVKMGLDFLVTNKFRIGFGVGFQQQQVRDMKIQFSRQYYSLGVVQFNQDIVYDRLNFIDFNVHAHYILRKFTVGLEISPTFLVGVRSTMDQSFTEDGIAMDVEDAPSVHRKFIHTENLNTVGVQAGLSVQYEFAKKFVVELGISSRLNSLLNTDLFNSPERKFPMKLELGLIKRF